MDLQKIDISSFIGNITNIKPCSQLGFFSKPYRIKVGKVEIIVKRYYPLKKKAAFIIESHDKYIKDLKNTGVNIPDTRITSIRKGSKQELIVIQSAFKENELVRKRFSKDPLEILLQFLRSLYDETINFWINNPTKTELGFHPTLRNYAIKDGELYYFDTIPPMNMQQNILNQIIIQMAPISALIKPLVPIKAINRVSDEYYSVEKMIIGLLGSSIRLRPEYAKEFLSFTKAYINSCKLDNKEKFNLLQKLDTPPALPLYWRIIRKLAGNIGKPNVTLPTIDNQGKLFG